jgi:hypothetical protein
MISGGFDVIVGQLVCQCWNTAALLPGSFYFFPNGLTDHMHAFTACYV